MTFSTNYRVVGVTDDGIHEMTEPVPDSTLITREELQKIKADAWDAALLSMVYGRALN
jgi:hypothetical protein